jgi:hypothetical protein
MSNTSEYGGRGYLKILENKSSVYIFWDHVSSINLVYNEQNRASVSILLNCGLINKDIKLIEEVDAEDLVSAWMKRENYVVNLTKDN